MEHRFDLSQSAVDMAFANPIKQSNLSIKSATINKIQSTAKFSSISSWGRTWPLEQICICIKFLYCKNLSMICSQISNVENIGQMCGQLAFKRIVADPTDNPAWSNHFSHYLVVGTNEEMLLAKEEWKTQTRSSSTKFCCQRLQLASAFYLRLLASIWFQSLRPLHEWPSHFAPQLMHHH